ncbi:MAG: MoaD/ThiS family protein [Planctomycetes bacterium]|nr:MoaD/ThiS family protein [Planctomycetota bacterium]
MRVKVLLFGREREVLGRTSLELEVPEGMRADDLLVRLDREWPQVKGARLAVNHAFATGGEEIRPADELALIGMVSGG